jgi:hypothetical protein
MSLERVEDFARGLPPRLREDVLGYARSVQSALPEIFENAGVRETSELRDQVVFIAGVKKLHAICSSTFWILENSLSRLQQADIRQVRLGGLTVSRGSRMWTELRDTVTAIEAILAQQGLLQFVSTPSYAEILRELTDGR